MSMITHRLQQQARRILSHSSRTRFFCSSTNGDLTSRPRNNTLQSRIEAALDEKSEVSTVLEQWRQHQGNRLNPSLVRGIVENLRDSQRFRHALEVSDWMIEQKICNLVPEDFTARFHLIENVLGLEEAENFFDSIPENQRGDALYAVLLKSYARRKAVDKAESTFKKMRELGLLLTTSPYSSMTSLYSSLGNREKVDEMLREMEESNIEFDSLTVNNALRVYAAVSDVATMEKFLNDWDAITTLEWLTTLDMAKAYLRDGSSLSMARLMLRRTERLKDPESYQELMRMYGEVGQIDGIYRTWDLYKNTREKDNEGFRVLIDSLLNVNDIEGAEDVYYNEWECSGLEFDVRIPTLLASGYCVNGMVNKAYKLMNKTMRNREFDRPITPLLEVWGKKMKPSDLRDLIKNLRDSNQFYKALEASSWMAEKMGVNFFPEDYAARLYLIENELGLAEAERFFKKGIPEGMKDQSVYTTLLSFYSRSGKTLHKAEATFETMRDHGFLSKPSPFNLMISLYSQLGRRRDVENVLCKMKEKNIEPDSLTVNNVLLVYAETDIETMEVYKRELVDANKKTKLEVRTMVAMGKAYERAGQMPKAIEITGSEEEVHRLWNEYKEKEKKKIGSEGYRSVISSLLKLDDVKGAEEMYGEWKQQGAEFDRRIPCMLISRYCEEGDEVKVRELLDSSRKSWKRTKFRTG